MWRSTGGGAPHGPPRPASARRLAAAAAVVLASALLAGCGGSETGGGGRVIGDTLTVVSLLPISSPDKPAAREILRGEKLALAQARGRAGAYKVNYDSIDSGGAEPGRSLEEAAAATRIALSDSQAIAVIGSLDYGEASASVPLLNAAGILHVSPTVGYAGFTSELSPAEPERWYPAGRRTFVPLGGSDLRQAEVMVRVARRLAGSRRPRVAIEREAEPDEVVLADAIADAARRSGARIVEDVGRADAVLYAGDDADDARGVIERLGRDAPDAVVIVGDDLARTTLDERLPRRAGARVAFVSRAPRPGSSEALRAFEGAYEKAYGSPPGPYAAVGHAAMRAVLRDGIARAGARANERAQVIEAFLDAPRDEPVWSAYEMRGSKRRYLPAAVTAAG